MYSNPASTPARANHRTFLITVLLWIACLGSGCATTERVRTATIHDFTAVMHPGDNVDCIFTDGSRASLTLAAVETDALVTASRRIERREIKQLEFTKVDGKRTATTSASIAVGMAIATAAVLSLI